MKIVASSQLCEKITSLPDDQLQDYLEQLARTTTADLTSLLSYVNKDGNNALMLALITRKKYVSKILSLLQRKDFPEKIKKAILSQANLSHAEGITGFTSLMLAIHPACSEEGGVSPEEIQSLWLMMPKKERPAWLAKQLQQTIGGGYGEYHGLNAMQLAFAHDRNVCDLVTSPDQLKDGRPAYIFYGESLSYWDGKTSISLPFLPQDETSSCLFLTSSKDLASKTRNKPAYVFENHKVQFFNKGGVLASTWLIPESKREKVAEIFLRTFPHNSSEQRNAQVKARTDIASLLGPIDMGKRFSMSCDEAKIASMDDLEHISRLTQHKSYLSTIQRDSIQQMLLTSLMNFGVNDQSIILSQTTSNGLNIVMTLLQKGSLAQVASLFDMIEKLPDNIRAAILSQCTQPISLGGNILTQTINFAPNLLEKLLPMILTLAIEEQETIFSDLGKWVLMMTDAGVSTEVLSFYESMIKKLPSHAQITVLSEKIQGKNLWQLVCEKNPDVTRKLLPLILALPADSVSNLLAFHRKPHRDKTPVTESTKALMTLIEGKTSNREGLQAYHELAFCLDALEKKKVSLHGKLNGLYTAYLRSTDMSVSDFTTKWQTAINESLPQLLQERLPMAKFKDVVTLIAKTFYCLTVLGACHLVHKRRSTFAPMTSQKMSFFKDLKKELVKTDIETTLDDLTSKVVSLSRK